MNVRPGQMAIVTISPETPDALGRICEVLRSAGLLSTLCYGDVPCWWVKFPTPTECADGVLAYEVFAADFQLRPVSGLPDTEDTDIEQPIKEAA